jgi:predicted NAD-dependent protein-ADP-ribosyltransferase YbiA (DUF1768 family)
MELSPTDAKTLRDMVAKEWFPHEERELESTFGVNGVVDSTRFLAVAQRLKSKGLKEIRQPDRLTISLEDNTRYTIQGEGTIAQYCQDNKIAGKSATIMIKDRAGDLHTLDLKEYDTRIKIRRELPLDLQDPRVKSHYATWDQRVKFFRLIQRWTFVGKGVIFDLSMVRSTKKDDRGLWKQVKKFYDEDLHHNIMKEMPSYEIEVELERGKDDTDTPDKALQCLIQGIGDVLKGIQRNPILIRNSVRDKVLEGYNTLVGADAEGRRKGFRGVQPVTLERVNIEPPGTSLKIRSIHGSAMWGSYNVTDKADGLRVMGYCNDKGELFMIDMGMNVYRTGLKKLACANTLVDGEWITQNKDGEAVQMLMLFDIYHGLPDAYGRLAYTKPFYFEEESSDTRYKELLKWSAAWRSEGGPITLVKGLTPQNSLKVMEKKFLFGKVDPSTDIFVKAGQMLARKVNYNTDGLIFTSNAEPIPENFGVRFPTQFKWKPSHDNTIDFLVKIVKDPETGLDKLTDTIRSDSQDTLKYKTLRLYVGTSADPAYDDPRRTILLIKKLPSGRPGGRGKKQYRMRPVLFSPKAFEDSSASICYLAATEDPATRDCIIRCSTKEDAPGEASGDPITNNSIVEMRYDPDPNVASGWNWIPLRVRYDKTERFQSGTIEKTLNSVETAESVWKSIHDPITPHMITTGDLLPSPEEEAAIRIAQEQNASQVKRYYQKKSMIKNIGLVKSMAAFHNIGVKGNLLTLPVLVRTGLGLPEKKIILDTSIGKGGDLGRYYDYASFLVGVDLDADGIRDPDEGAYRRYLDALVSSANNRFANIPPMLFLIGDSTKSYIDGSSAINEEEADMMRATFGKVPPKAKVPPYIDAKCRGQLKDGAHLMTSMFSIHYYFETKEKWEGYLNNIRDNLMVGGFFVCCCFDGNIVVDKTKEIEKGEAIEGVDPITNSTIWRITKANSLEEILPATPEEGFGHAIDVEFLSIGSVHREYLVSPQLLMEQLRSIGCELVTQADRSLLGLSAGTELFQTTYESIPSYASQYPMSDEVKNFSFLNRWYVFRRYGTAPGVARAENASTVTVTEDLPPGWRRDANPYSRTGYVYIQNEYGIRQENKPAADWRPGQGQASFGGPGPSSPLYAPTSPVYAPTSPVYAPTSPVVTAAAAAAAPASPAYSPSSPVVAAAALNARPASLAWNAIPISGNLAQAQALQAARTPPLPPATPPLYGEGPRILAEGDVLPPGPVYDADMDPSNRRNAEDEWEDRKYSIEQMAKEEETARLPADISAEDREARLTAAAGRAVAAAIQRYQNRQQAAASGLVTAVVEGGGSQAATGQGSGSQAATGQGGARTVAVEKGIAAGPQKKYKASEVLRFFGRAELKDVLKINDPGAARWLALSAPFPIKDGETEYPTVNHYLGAMKFKLATDKPELAADLFSSKGTIHTKYLRLREQIAGKHKGEKEKSQVKEHEDQELLRNEAADVAEAALPKTIKRYKAQFNEAQWIAQKDDVLKQALKQRWNHDARFRKIVEAARTQNKYLLYYTGSTTITSFGGIRRDDGRIEGENQVGKIIMELAGYPPV